MRSFILEYDDATHYIRLFHFFPSEQKASVRGTCQAWPGEAPISDARTLIKHPFP
jgi:hypothetical protein